MPLLALPAAAWLGIVNPVTILACDLVTLGLASCLRSLPRLKAQGVRIRLMQGLWAAQSASLPGS